ncbi:MAG TPA: sugar phosphate nucleotidyltransferase [Solirubrobacteraceae bacterium]|nr:sugar phosphate nucleotidyltransferase [Solirubrobacteraceae bacterium]
MADALAPFCVLAGGLATRLGERARREPKALMVVAGRPFIFHQLELLRSHGARRIVLCVGHLGERVRDAVGDGSALGLDVRYSFDGPRPIGTAGAVREALPLLDERFYVLYGDTYLRIDYAAVSDAFVASGKPALMTVLRNEGRWDTSNVLYSDGAVIAYDKREPTAEMRWIDYGLGVLTAEAVTTAAPDAADLADVYSELAARGELAGYEATERFYEIGTPAALAETDAFLREHADAAAHPPDR